MDRLREAENEFKILNAPLLLELKKPAGALPAVRLDPRASSSSAVLEVAFDENQIPAIRILLS